MKYPKTETKKASRHLLFISKGLLRCLFHLTKYLLTQERKPFVGQYDARVVRKQTFFLSYPTTNFLPALIIFILKSGENIHAFFNCLLILPSQRQRGPPASLLYQGMPFLGIWARTP